jgi:hypothetical protein
MRTGDQLLVAAGQQTFTVTPPKSGAMYMSARCAPRDIRKGDSVRVSLTNRGTNNPNAPYVATLINIYRKDSGEAISEEDPEGETINRVVSRRKASKARRDFRVGQRLLDGGKRPAAMKYFEKAREADPSDEMAQRIADALRQNTTQEAAP